MRTGIFINLKPADRRRLKGLARDRNTPHKHVWRAEIVLLSADGVGTNEIMRRTGKSKTCVWRWQERFMQEGYDGLLRDKTRPSRIRPLGSSVTERVVTLTQSDPPAEVIGRQVMGVMRGDDISWQLGRVRTLVSKTQIRANGSRGQILKVHGRLLTFRPSPSSRRSYSTPRKGARRREDD